MLMKRHNELSACSVFNHVVFLPPPPHTKCFTLYFDGSQVLEITTDGYGSCPDGRSINKGGK